MSDAGTTTTTQGDGTTTTNTGPAAGTFGADPEFAKFDDDERGFFANKGWDRKPTTVAIRELAKSYREAEKHLRAPADQVIRFPKDANDVENWNTLRERLGVPKDVKGYDFTGVKFGDGTELDQPFVDMMSKAALANGIPKDAAVELTKQFVQFMDDADKSSATVAAAEQAREFDALKRSWGNNFEANTFIANQAAEKLGLPKDFIDAAIKGGASRLQLSQGFLKLGIAMGEDKFVADPGSPTRGVMTAEQAQAKMDALRNDAQWTARYLDGGRAEIEEMHALSMMVVGRAA